MEVTGDTPKEDEPRQQVAEYDVAAEEDLMDAESCTTGRKKNTVINWPFCLSASVHQEEELDQAEGIDKALVTCTLCSSLASRKKELHLMSSPISVRTDSRLGGLDTGRCLLSPLRKSEPGGGSRYHNQNQGVGHQRGTGRGWEGEEGVTGTTAPAPGQSLYTSENTYSPPCHHFPWNTLPSC